MTPEKLRFLPVRDSAVTRWRRPQRFDFLHRLRMAPISDTELLHLSHYCPVALTLPASGPRVVVLLDPSLLASDPVARDGRWRPPYAPIALRNLPFWPGARHAEIEIAPELVGGVDDGGFALRTTSGEPTEQFAVAINWVERLQQGMRRLSEAAKLLVAADVLSPLGLREQGAEPIETDYHMVSPEKYFALSPERAAALSADGGLPLDLAAASFFSRRLLSRRVVMMQSAAPDEPRRAAAASWGDALVEPLDIDLRLDASPLFSFERFGRNAEDPKARPHADA